jgi:nucleoside-diphosphate-sugar epimerase
LLTHPNRTRTTVDLASGNPTPVGAIVAAMARVAGSDITIRHDGVTEEYIEFRSGDRRMADEYGFVPRIPFEEGFGRLRQFVAAHDDAAVRG